MREEIMLALEQNQGHASAMKDAQIKSYDFVKIILWFHNICVS